MLVSSIIMKKIISFTLLPKAERNKAKKEKKKMRRLQGKGREFLNQVVSF